MVNDKVSVALISCEKSSNRIMSRVGKDSTDTVVYDVIVGDRLGL